MLELIVTKSPGMEPNAGHTYALSEPRPYVLGRNPKADICIDHPKISRSHLLFTARPGKWTVKDLDTTIGTKFNGEPLKAEQAINVGDSIEIHGFTLVATAVRAPIPEGDDTWELDAGLDSSLVRPR